MNEDRSTRYHRLKRQFVILGWVWTLLLLGGLTWTGWSVALRDAAESAAVSIATAASFPGLPWVPALTVLIYVLLLCALNEVGSLPLGWYSGHVIERRYGLSNESLGALGNRRSEVARDRHAARVRRRGADLFPHPALARLAGGWAPARSSP